jgi:hypothetical protein
MEVIVAAFAILFPSLVAQDVKAVHIMLHRRIPDDKLSGTPTCLTGL